MKEADELGNCEAKSLSVEEFKKDTGWHHLSDQEAEDIIFSLGHLADIVIHHLANTNTS